ncbi:MAG: pyridoxamine 5'-phosphate oxidase [Aquificae bacterium]|nr:pyridoxamine 5'-phosphate oxidase [Aquificota bacterium]
MLPKEVINLMRNLNVFPVVLGSSDEEGNLHITFITWVYPLDERTLRIALSSDSKTAENLRKTGKVAIQIFAPGVALSCYGRASEVLSEVRDLPFRVSVFEVAVESVENSLFPGATVTGIIPFAHTGNVLKMTELDTKVLEALKGEG